MAHAQELGSKWMLWAAVQALAQCVAGCIKCAGITRHSRLGRRFDRWSGLWPGALPFGARQQRACKCIRAHDLLWRGEYAKTSVQAWPDAWSFDTSLVGWPR